MAHKRYENLNQLVSALLYSSIVSDGHPIYNTAVFIFNRGLDRLKYVEGLTPELWSRLPRELIIFHIAGALGAILFNSMSDEPDAPYTWSSLRHQCRAQLRKAALTCRRWECQICPFLFLTSLRLLTMTRVHELEKITSSPMS